MLTSPRSSSALPATIFIGQEPSARCMVGTQSRACSAASTWPPTSIAMAASTWFQMSTCSPTVQGTAPHGSCIAAIAAAVSAPCWAVRIASTYGSCASGSVIGDRGLGLAEVEDHALADQRVEDLADVLE